MEALFLRLLLFQAGNHRRLAKQKDVWTTFRRACRQCQQGFDRGIIQLFSVVHQQIDFLAGQRQLHHLRQDRADIGLSHIQCLGDLAQHANRLASATS